VRSRSAASSGWPESLTCHCDAYYDLARAGYRTDCSQTLSECLTSNFPPACPRFPPAASALTAPGPNKGQSGVASVTGTMSSKAREEDNLPNSAQPLIEQCPVPNCVNHKSNRAELRRQRERQRSARHTEGAPQMMACKKCHFLHRVVIACLEARILTSAGPRQNIKWSGEDYGPWGQLPEPLPSPWGNIEWCSEEPSTGTSSNAMFWVFTLPGECPS